MANMIEYKVVLLDDKYLSKIVDTLKAKSEMSNGYVDYHDTYKVLPQGNEHYLFSVKDKGIAIQCSKEDGFVKIFASGKHIPETKELISKVANIPEEKIILRTI